MTYTLFSFEVSIRISNDELKEHCRHSDKRELRSRAETCPAAAMTTTTLTSLENQHGGYTDWLFPGGPGNRDDIVGGSTSSAADENNTTVLLFDEDEYLETRLGFRYRSIGESVTLTFVYCLVLFTGVVGNVVTCVVIIRNSYMHTATNCYLFSLAVSDTLALVLGLPPELYSVWEAYPWRFGEPYCLFKTFLTELMSSASILTITAFTIERFVAICHPLWAQKVCNPSRAIKTVFVIWLSASITALPYPINTRTFHYLHHPITDEPLTDSLVCNIPLDWMPQMKYVIQASTILLFVLPMCVMTALYVSIALALRRSSPEAIIVQQASLLTRCANNRQQHGESHAAEIGIVDSCIVRQLQQQEERADDTSSSVHLTALRATRRGSANVQPVTNSRRAILPLLVAVLVMFFICWAPFHAQRILTACVPDDSWNTTLIEIQSTLFYISGILYYVSSTVNPILYNLMSYRYRRAFRDTLHCVTRRSSTRRAAVSRDTSSRAGSTRLSCGSCAAMCGASAHKPTSFRSSSLIHHQQQQQQQQQQSCSDHPLKHYRHNHGRHLLRQLQQQNQLQRGYTQRTAISTCATLAEPPVVRTLPSHHVTLSICCS